MTLQQVVPQLSYVCHKEQPCLPLFRTPTFYLAHPFLLWKKYRAAIPHPSPFRQTPFRHPNPGSRAQVFPGLSQVFLGQRWGISPP